jgi:hypothetical protein
MRKACCLAYVALIAAGAWADGMFAGPSYTKRVAGTAGVASTEQKAVMIELPEGREALLLQTTYHGPADRFAWVIPVPGKPGQDDVFLAAPQFIDEFMDATRPQFDTRILDSARPFTMGFAGSKRAGPPSAGGTLGEGGPPGGSPPTVTVHERMTVGDYDVSVLSATGTTVLTDWLTRNGYRPPEGSEAVFRHYVEKQWYFVALRMQPGKVEQRPLLEDVAPIGIRFPTKQLVYPLYISRASSRPKTAMLLLLLSNTPLKCDQLAEARLPLRKWQRKGTCYASLRRKTVEKAGLAAVCEYRGPEGFPYLDLYFRKDAWHGPEGGWSPRTQWATRYWTILDREKMDDLTFSPSQDRRTVRLVVSRRGEIWYPLLTRLTATSQGLMWLFAFAGAGAFLLASWAANRGFAVTPGCVTSMAIGTPVLVMLLLVLSPLSAMLIAVCSPLILLRMAWRPLGGESESLPRFSPLEMARGAFVAAGAGAFGHLAVSALVGGIGFLTADGLGARVLALWRAETPALWTVAAVALQLAWVIVALDLAKQALKGGGPRAVWVPVLWVVLVAFIAPTLAGPALGGRIVEHLRAVQGPPPTYQAAMAAAVFAITLVTFGALLLLIAFLIVGPSTGPKARRVAQPMAQTLLVLVLLAAITTVVGMRAAHAGGGGFISTGTKQLDQSLRQLDDLLTRFRKANGCYPARLADLAGAKAPAEGLDSSGNRVPISRVAPPGGAQEAEALPVDPLTGRGDRWVYEPTGSPMIDSGGYEIRIEQDYPQDPDDMAKWKPGQPLAPLNAMHVRPYLYWQAEEEGGDGPSHGPMDSANAIVASVPHAKGPVGRLAVGRESVRFVSANVAGHSATVGHSRLAHGALAVSLNGQRVVYASNGRRTTRIEVAPPVRSGFVASTPVLDRPWPVEVYDIAWRPNREQWLIVARPLDGDARARLYLLERDGAPRAITDLGNFTAAGFTTDGQSIIALRTKVPWVDESWAAAHSGRWGPPGSPPPESRALLPRLLGRPHAQSGRAQALAGALELLSLEGRTQKVLAEQVLAEPLAVSRWGWAGIEPGPEGDRAVLWVDRTGAVRSVTLPVTGVVVGDVWLGEQELAVSLARAKPGNEYEEQGEVQWYSLATGKWRLVARWRLVSTSRGDRPPDALVIVGRDTATGAYVLGYQDYQDMRAYAVRDQEPRLELLRDGDSPEETKPVQVDVGGKAESVTSDGVFWARAFNTGDLMGMDDVNGTPLQAFPVAERSGGTLLVGEQRINLPTEEIPVIGDEHMELHVKLRRR